MASILSRFALAAILLGLSVAEAGAQGWYETATYRNQRHGFSISYPSQQFAPQAPADNPDGRVWVSRDGNARLLAGALPNADGMTLQQYRDVVLQQSYPGAVVDYAPVRGNWFVLSGTRDGTIFYHVRRANDQQLGDGVPG
jgi:hypothetical protein